ncbi:MAG: hypothetical protein J5554_12010, partial [Paludibacteraceae bacterium]|nr:hypothetical protein [Paludibacteraceae bacterium]
VNENFNVLNFVVEDGWIKITPLDVIVTITGNTRETIYNGLSQDTMGYVWSATTPLYKVEDFVFSGDSTVQGTTIGKYDMGLAEEQFTNVNENFNVLNFVVEDGWIKITPLDVIVTITGNTRETIYNGLSQDTMGYVWSATTPLYKVDDFTFSGDSTVQGTTIGKYFMNLVETQFANVNENFGEVKFDVTDGWINISPLDLIVTITGNTKETIYNGLSQDTMGYVWSANTPLYKVDDFTFSGDSTVQGTTIGKYFMNLAETQFANVNENFGDVKFDVTDGWINISPLDVIVTITGNTRETIYNGQEQDTMGYVWSATTPLYKVDDFTFSGDSTVQGTTIGKYDMGLAENQFTNVNDNFNVLNFVVEDGWIKITPLDVIVTITGNTRETIYNGLSQDTMGYVWSATTPLYKVVDFTFSGDSTVQGTTIGTYDMGLAENQFTNVNDNFNVLNFVVEDGWIKITPLEGVVVTITKHSETITYDGKEHVVTGYDFEPSDPLYKEEYMKFNGTEADSTAKGTTIGSYGMSFDETYFVNVNENFKDVKFIVNSDDSLRIESLGGVIVTITKHSETVTYDGQEHVVTGYDFESNNPLYIEEYMKFNGMEADTISKGTTIGSYGMSFDETYFENTNENFRDVEFIVKSDDSLRIKPLEGVVVTITEHSNTFMYDGASHTVTGYDVEINNSLYKVSDFTFNGDSTITGTDEGEYSMPIEPADFVNENVNFADVKFVVVQGTMLITPREGVVVTITKHSDTFVYDGNEHTISGYDFESNDPSYIEAYMKFNGTEADSTSTGTTVGSYGMNFDKNFFENTNVNFKDVEFIVNSTDSLRIEALEGVIVTITEHADTFIFDGQSHKVTGYDVAINNALYKESDFTFNGDSTVTGMDEGKYSMLVEEKDFVNMNLNFADVKFVVVPDTMLIQPLENVVVTITKHGGNFIYDGESHTISGYDFESTTPLYLEQYMKFNGMASDTTVTARTVGSYRMAFDETFFENVNPNFKDVKFVVVNDDSLVIEPLGDVLVTITEHGGEFTYNAKEHTVSGYDAKFSTDLYGENDFVFSGNATVSAVEVGKRSMDLTPADFENKNPNFKDVRFEVVEDTLTIVPLNVLVSVKGNKRSVNCDGILHVVSGYTWNANSGLYAASDFNYRGDSLISGMTVGSYDMQLDSADFENTNPNFNVTFKLENGWLLVRPATTPKPIIVTDLISSDYGCNPMIVAPTEDDFSVVDECEGTKRVDLADSGEQIDGCLHTRTWTASYTNVCGLEAESVAITYTWIVDTVAPIIITEAKTEFKGCDPVIEAPRFAVSDNCEGTFKLSADNVVVTDVKEEGYSRTQTWTATYVDGCGNVAEPVSVTYTWNVSSEPVEFSAVACGSYEWNGETFTESGDYPRTLQNTAGCDSVVTMHLTIHPVYAIDTVAVACASFSWYGDTFTETGDYRKEFTTTEGCDSILTLHLTINPVYAVDTTAVVCDEFTWYGETYRRSGVYPKMFTTVAGCDSLVTLHLTVNRTQIIEEFETVCGGYYWRDRWLDQTGIYRDSLIASTGCDSVHVLYLKVNKSVYIDTTIFACDSYEMDGEVFVSSGNFKVHRISDLGCDSVFNIHLVLGTNSFAELEDSVILGEGYNWHGFDVPAEDLDRVGTYLFRSDLSAVTGCDSVVELKLVVYKPDTDINIVWSKVNDTYFCAGDEVIISYSYSTGRPTDYVVEFGDEALDLGLENFSGRVNKDGTISFTVPEDFPSGVYTASFQLFGNGLESVKKSFRFVVNMSNECIVKMWTDVVACNNAEGRFVEYQWYLDGELIEGATKQYYCDLDGLDGTYSLRVKTVEGDYYYICGKYFERESAPFSITTYPNPAKANRDFSIEVFGLTAKDLKRAQLFIYTEAGNLAYKQLDVDFVNRVALPVGNYVAILIVDNGKSANSKITVLP